MSNHLEVSLVRGQSVVTRLVHASPCRLFSLGQARPGGPARTMMGNYGGGFIQDDEINLGLVCREDSVLVLGSQANTQVLTNNCGRAALFKLEASIEARATLIYTPEPVVMHTGAMYRQFLKFEIAKGGRLAMVDWFQSGRSDSGERFQFTSYHSELDIRLEGKSLLLDSFGFEPARDDFASPMTLANYDYFASVILIGFPPDWLESSGLGAEHSNERFRIEPFGQQISKSVPGIFRADWQSDSLHICRIHASQRIQIQDFVNRLKTLLS